MSVIKPILQRPDQIAYFSGANNYCWTYFRDGSKKLLAKPISYLEEQLPTFVRVHKTALINPVYVKGLYQPPRKKMTGKIIMDTGEELPVSRRRWDYVVESLQKYALTGGESEELSIAPVSGESTVDAPAPSVFMITTHELSETMAELNFQKHWPTYRFHKNTQSAFLPDMLESVPEGELPTLIFLDARTSTLERLRTLHRLKASEKLRSIPVILFASPTDQAVIAGYQHQANSVISVPAGCPLPNEILERTCRFWLQLVQLPRAEKS